VEFKSFVAPMFTDKSLRGKILHRALTHQHGRIYNYDKSTVYGTFDQPSEDLSKQFLDFVHYDQGGRIFTYVLTLDGQLRFTETGKEFGIDLLSKHTMHSDVAQYIAFSGEFFVRRLKHPHAPRRPTSSTSNTDDALPPEGEDVEEERSQHENEKLHDPMYYQLFIDNDSGTYRPNAKMLPKLKGFLAANFRGLKIHTLDCQGDEEKMNKLKQEQRDIKGSSGQQITYLQNNSMSSLSSSDEEALQRRAEGKVNEPRYKREYHKYVDGGEDHHHDDGRSTEPVNEKDSPSNTAGQESSQYISDGISHPQTNGVVGKEAQKAAKENGEAMSAAMERNYEDQRGS
jgi:hypothetical protein